MCNRPIQAKEDYHSVVDSINKYFSIAKTCFSFSPHLYGGGGGRERGDILGTHNCFQQQGSVQKQTRVGSVLLSIHKVPSHRTSPSHIQN